MGIFTRVRDIINSNINSMLDKAEDPEKLVKLMIREMEDTLVEIKASCARSMADKKRVARLHAEVEGHASDWGAKAKLAVGKNREDMAREALIEKRHYTERAVGLAAEVEQFDALVANYQRDIVQLEDKLSTARDKQRILVQRHVHARNKKRAQQNIRRIDTPDVMLRFEKFENRIEHMEAQADLVNYGRKTPVADAFAELETDEEIEKELAALKEAAGKGADTGTEL